MLQRSPVIICGCHGSGTSFVTKMLRWHGFFTGEDSGRPTDRKLHESKVYTKTNEAMLQHLTGGCTFGMRTVDADQWAAFESGIRDADRRAEALALVDPQRLGKKYWGGNRYTYPLHRLLKARRVWGWKDPRNSLTLPLWFQRYPTARVLVIQQDWRPGQTGRSGSGSWFKETSTPEVRATYMNPAYLEAHPDIDAYRFGFEEVADYEAVARLMAWVGLPDLSEGAYETLLTNIDYER